MDIARYTAAKEAGTIVLQRHGDEVSFVHKQFDVATGLEVRPLIGIFNRDQLLAQKAELQKQIDALNTQMAAVDVMVADTEALLAP